MQIKQISITSDCSKFLSKARTLAHSIAIATVLATLQVAVAATDSCTSMVQVAKTRVSKETSKLRYSEFRRYFCSQEYETLADFKKQETELGLNIFEYLKFDYEQKTQRMTNRQYFKSLCDDSQSINFSDEKMAATMEAVNGHIERMYKFCILSRQDSYLLIAETDLDDPTSLTFTLPNLPGLMPSNLLIGTQLTIKPSEAIEGDCRMEVDATTVPLTPGNTYVWNCTLKKEFLGRNIQASAPILEKGWFRNTPLRTASGGVFVTAPPTPPSMRAQPGSHPSLLIEEAGVVTSSALLGQWTEIEITGVTRNVSPWYRFDTPTFNLAIVDGAGALGVGELLAGGLPGRALQIINNRETPSASWAVDTGLNPIRITAAPVANNAPLALKTATFPGLYWTVTDRGTLGEKQFVKNGDVVLDASAAKTIGIQAKVEGSSCDAIAVKTSVPKGSAIVVPIARIPRNFPGQAAQSCKLSIRLCSMPVYPLHTKDTACLP